MVISNSVNVVTSSPPAVVTITPVADPINTALVLNYKFNESSGTTISDSSGNGNNATLYNDFASAWAPGRVDGAIVLNNGPAGSDCPSYIQTDVNILLANQDNYSFAFWAKALPRTSLANPRIFTPAAPLGSVAGHEGRGILERYARYCGAFHRLLASFCGDLQPAGWHLYDLCGRRSGHGQRLGIESVAHRAKSNGSSVIPKSSTALGEGDKWKGYLSDVRMYNRA